MPDKGWARRFDQPIVLKDGAKLLTLREAVQYLAKTVPKKEQQHPAILTASTILTNAAERGPAWMFLARAAVLQAILRHEPPRPINPDRKDTHWGKRKLKRDL